MARRSTLRIRVYRAKDGWRWRMTAGNSRIVADGGEAYTRRGDAARAVDRLLGYVRHGATITVVDP